MVGWHHRLNGHGFGWTPGVGDGQGGLACFGPWGCKELDIIELLKNCMPQTPSFPLLYHGLYPVPSPPSPRDDLGVGSFVLIHQVPWFLGLVTMETL